jgi:hypothetical protein
MDVSSSIVAGPFGSAASHRRLSGVRTRAVHSIACRATWLKLSTESRPQATLSWFPRTIPATGNNLIRSITALGSAP